jgi:hypothetical protein
LYAVASLTTTQLRSAVEGLIFASGALKATAAQAGLAPAVVFKPYLDVTFAWYTAALVKMVEALKAPLMSSGVLPAGVVIINNTVEEGPAAHELGRLAQIICGCTETLTLKALKLNEAALDQKMRGDPHFQDTASFIRRLNHFLNNHVQWVNRLINSLTHSIRNIERETEGVRAWGRLSLVSVKARQCG